MPSNNNKQKRATSKEEPPPNNNETDPNDTDSQSNKRLRSSSSTQITPTKSTAIVPNKQSQKQVLSYIQELFDTIRTYRDTASSKCPSETFARLPSKRAHAQYYTQILEPIDLTQIQQKITDSVYVNVDEFEQDFTLLITNAKTFYKNSKTSVEFKDAQILWDLFETEKKKRIDIMMSLLDQDEDENEEEDDNDQEETTPTKRASRKTKAKTATTASKDESPSSSSLSVSEAKISLRKQQPKVNLISPSSTVHSESTSSLTPYLEEYFHVIAAYKCPETKRSLATVFYMLPSSKLYPDYYETIQNPIDMKTIAKRIRQNVYKTLKQMEADFILMTDNAKRYNAPKSIIYKDACKLKVLAKETAKTLSKQPQLTETTVRFKIVNELAELTQNEFNKKLLEAEAEAAAALLSHPKTPTIKTNKKVSVKADEEEEEDEDEEEDDDEEEEEEKSNNTNATANATPTATGNFLSGKRNHPLMIAMWSLFDYMRDYTNEAGVSIVEPFVKLPSKVIYPDYFEEIKQPISLNQIKSKLHKRVYGSLQELSQDFALLFANAMQYNLEDSVIYGHAKELKRVYEEKCGQVAASLEANGEFKSEALMNLTPVKEQHHHHHHGKKQQQQRINEMSGTSASGSTSSGLLKKSNYDKLPKFNDMRERITFLYNYMSDFELDGRELAYPFRHLPSKLDYPDYYNIIKRPIDMNKIFHKVTQVGKSIEYANLDEMCSDFAQMFENACTYNEPTSTLYKDALSMQRALFMKRDEIYRHDGGVSDAELPASYVANCLQEIIHELFKACMLYQDSEGRFYADSFLQLYVMIDASSLVTIGENQSQQQIHDGDLITLEFMRKRVETGAYKRLDVFQTEMFLFFDQIRRWSFIEGDYKLKKDRTDLTENQHKRIHRYSQLYRDAYEMQKYFIQKRDELCKNGDVLQSGAFNYKQNALDSQMSMTIGGQTFDEAEALLVEARFKVLEANIEGVGDKSDDDNANASSSQTNLCIGQFYYVPKQMIVEYVQDAAWLAKYESDTESSSVVCILAQNKKRTRFIVQLYLSRDDIDTNAKRVRRFIKQELFKSDLYALINTTNTKKFKPCFVVSIKDFLLHEFSLNLEKSDETGLKLDKDLYICESMYSTHSKYFRKLSHAKKWQPLKFLGKSTNTSLAPTENETLIEDNGGNEETNAINNTNDILIMKKRSNDGGGMDSNLHYKLIIRSFIDESAVKQLKERVDKRLDEWTTNGGWPAFFKQSYCDTVQYDTPPARFKEEKEPDEVISAADMQHLNNQNLGIEDDAELMKTAKYYEQLVISQNEIYKIGDHVYIKNENTNANNSTQLVQTQSKLPLIVRIDRLWSIETPSGKKYYLRGPLFLRAIDIDHEPTRLFYPNEVMREQSRDITASLLDQVVSATSSGAKKCVVMSNKKFVSSRLTEIDERDVYVCEAKYSMHTKTFRKFTKYGIRKIELSVKCMEDEVYFLRRELQLRKNLSPLLVNMSIVYEDENHGAGYEQNFDNENPNSNDDFYDDYDEYDEDASNSQFDAPSSTHSPNPSGVNSRTAMKSTMIVNSAGVSLSLKKIRQKRDKKSAFNIFSREFRKSLRDTKSSLAFEQMSKEVGNRWRALTAQQRAEYEEKARIETQKEMRRMASERAAQEAAANAAAAVSQQQTHLQQQQQMYSPQIVHTNHINHILASQHHHHQQQQQQQQTHHQISSQQQIISNGLQQPQQQYLHQNNIQQQQYHLNSQYQNNGAAISHNVATASLTSSPVIVYHNNQQQQQIMQPPPPIQHQQPPPQQLGPRQVQHKEAYIKYISNLRKQQHLNSLPNTNSNANAMIAASLLSNGDWHSSLDTRPSRIKESRVMPPPAAWIENCDNHNDVLKHLVSLRCYMLQDAICIQKINTDNNLKINEIELNGGDDDSNEAKEPVLMEL